MSYSDILKLLIHIAAVAKAKLPAVMAWIEQTVILLEPDNSTASDSLQIVEPTEEEIALEGVLAQALAGEGSQAVFDGSRIRRLAALLKEDGPAILAILKLFGINVPSLPGVG